MADPKPFIATKPIYIGNALGYNIGDVVTDQVVKDHDLQDSVSREGTQAADATKPTRTSTRKSAAAKRAAASSGTPAQVEVDPQP